MGTPFEPIAERMMQAARLKNLSALARFLEVTPQALSNYKRRGEMPANLIIEFSQKQGSSMDWLVTGCPPLARAVYSGDFTPEEAVYIEKLLKILRMENGLGQVFRASIDAIVESESWKGGPKPWSGTESKGTEAPHA